MKSSISTRKWFIALQYIGLPTLLLLSVVSQPPGMSEQAGMLLSTGILLVWALTSIVLAEISYRRAETAKRQQEQFTADISHDLRTPTAALRTLLEVSQLDPKLKSHTPSQEVFTRALAQVDSITTLTGKLLRLSQFETTATPRLEPAKLQSILTKVCAQLEPLAKKKRQTIAITSSQTLHVYAVPDELAQLLVILLDNAIKFSPQKSAIHITATEQRSHVTLSIRDAGAGLTPQEQKHIFDRFYRTDSARQKAGTTSGFGLGLAIAAAVATRHKSKIIVTSTPGNGAAFSIRLKRA